MRRAFAKLLAPVALVGLFALGPASSAFSEDAQFEDVQSEGSQIAAAGASDEQPSVKSLNTTPVDGTSSQAAGSENPLVRKLTAARPNENLVICIAGCFSGRDRVVYAQPIERSSISAKSPAGPDHSGVGKQSANGNLNGTSGLALKTIEPPRVRMN
jgi:hypothetical protein